MPRKALLEILIMVQVSIANGIDISVAVRREPGLMESHSQDDIAECWFQSLQTDKGI